MEDIYGYQKVKLTLEHIADLLVKENKEGLAKLLLRAAAFYGGMPSEFLGESWLALKAVLEEKTSLSEEVVLEAKTLFDLIEDAFKKIGQQLNKN